MSRISDIIEDEANGLNDDGEAHVLDYQYTDEATVLPTDGEAHIVLDGKEVAVGESPPLAPPVPPGFVTKPLEDRRLGIAPTHEHPVIRLGSVSRRWRLAMRLVPRRVFWRWFRRRAG